MCKFRQIFILHAQGAIQASILLRIAMAPDLRRAQGSMPSMAPACGATYVEAMRPGVIALCVVAMVAAIVGVDVAFFRGRFWERLAVNVGVVLVFAAFYFRFARGP